MHTLAQAEKKEIEQQLTHNGKSMNNKALETAVT